MFIEPSRLPDGDKEILSIAIWCESLKIPMLDFMKRCSLQYIRQFEKCDDLVKTMMRAYELNPEQWPILDIFLEYQKDGPWNKQLQQQGKKP